MLGTSAHQIIVITGPTASGKSALSVSIAEALGGEIVNLDSVQIYRELDIGSAKISMEERKSVPHHLLDIRSPDHQYNVGEYVRDARQVILEILQRQKIPIIVGGPGLYLTALVHGLAELPPSDPSIRAELEAMSDEAIDTKINLVDPVSATRLHYNDRLRRIRAIETALISGKPSSVLQEKHAHRGGDFVACVVALEWPREVLYHRINLRTEKMIREGLMQECEGLFSNYGAEIPAFRYLGYAEALEVLQGRIPHSELLNRISQSTRRFAKRQLTYLRNEPRKRGWQVLPPTHAINLKECANFLQTWQSNDCHHFYTWDAASLVGMPEHH